MINLYDTIDEFEKYLLNESKKNYKVRLTENSSRMYLTKIKVFIEYLENEYEEPNINLRYLTEDNVKDSIKYYIDSRRIKFATTAQNYVTVIIRYFDFMQQKHGINNEIFNSLDRFNVLKHNVGKFINSFELNKSKPKNIIEEEDFNLLVYKCNKIINETSVESVINEIEHNTYYKLYYDLLSSLTIKLILYMGLKNNVVIDIDRCKYEEDSSRITVNNYMVHLPYVLNEQMKKYIIIRKQIIERNQNCGEKLFIKATGENFKDNEYGSKVFKILPNIIGIGEVESVSKYAVCKMMDIGIDRKQIMELTGFSFDTYLHCEEVLYEQKLEQYNSKNQIFEIESKGLDSKLRGLESFIKL